VGSRNLIPIKYDNDMIIKTSGKRCGLLLYYGFVNGFQETGFPLLFDSHQKTDIITTAVKDGLLIRV